MEIWKSIEGYEGLYQISNMGRIKSLEKIKNNQYGEFVIPAKFMTPKDNGNGYLALGLTKNKSNSTHKIHRLVAMAFCVNWDKNLQVNHINGIKTDNRIENIELCNNRENCSHKFLSKNKTSKHIGVSICKGTGKWQSHIQLYGKSVGLGRFETEIEAANAYKIALIENNIQNKYATV